jgi:hypothetical protein
MVTRDCNRMDNRLEFSCAISIRMNRRVDDGKGTYWSSPLQAIDFIVTDLNIIACF